MQRYRQLSQLDKEAGGILIGRILLENENFIIDDTSEPMPTDTRKRYRFIRTPEGHQEYFNNIWQKAEGRCFYLGEWHTHPERIPTPSSIDKKDWMRILKLDFESDILFFLIVGTKEIKVWYGQKKNKRIVELPRRD
ncbi:Mov34/MPN/PAD-1 family protein [Pseudalkalibacillus sp. SCS-8]|uniref:Mov34/MPN/PAD-1 family protein n=1 Tax=Pseudalkalibacillus nanhaiensis TaxID=3115291 RepID=UPI0032DA0D06